LTDRTLPETLLPAMDAAMRSTLLRRLELDARQLTRRFGLRYKSLDAERANVTSRYGVCFADGAIRIRLRHAVTGRPLKYSSLVNTLCHELAHLRHFDHGPRFKAFYFELLDFARACGIYRPGPTQPASPEPRPPQAPPATASMGPAQLSLL
jgi:predicted metal-dependent hydrolase